MNTKEAHRKLHEMKTSVNVVTNFLSTLEPRTDDEKELFELAMSSIEKLNSAMAELTELIDS